MELERLGCARRTLSFAGERGSGDIPGALLGRESRYAPDQPFETLHIALDLSFDLARKSAEGTSRTLLRSFSDLRSVQLDAAEMKILSVKDAEGRALSFKHEKGKLNVRFKKTLHRGAEFELTIRYRISKPRLGLHFVESGSKDALYPQVWSHAEPQDARYWFPCHDEPHTRLTSEARLTVPKGFVAVSNGVLLARSEHDDKAVFHWKMTRPHAPYLISVAVGRFSVIEDRWEDIPVYYYCEKGREEEARRAFGKTPKMLRFFSEKIGVKYPYEQYSQVAVSEFPGGMEHTTCTTQTDACLTDRTAALDTDFDFLVAHELAHQWFGDLLTCRDWAHAWLNEGFATYFEVLFCEHDKGKDEALYELLQNQRNFFHEDENRYRRPIVTKRYKSPWVLFDRHLYEKGALVLHLLRNVLGEEAWWRAIGHYVRTHQDRTVWTEDVIRAIRESTGRNLQLYFDQWVYRGGYPEFQVRYRFEGGKAKLVVAQTQKGEEALYALPADFRFAARGWERTIREQLSKKEHVFEFDLPGEPECVEFDPGRWILKKLEFKKPFSLWAGQLRLAANSRGRMEAAEELSRWGDERAVRLISEAFGREKFWGAQVEFAGSLGRVGTPAAGRALERLLSVRHPKVRRAVVAALGGLRSPRLEGRFGALARRDPSYHVRGQAARALAQLRDPSALRRIRPLLSERSWRDIVRASALDAYAASRLPEAVALLKRHAGRGFHFATRAAAVRGLGEFASQDPRLIGMLESLAKDERDERVQHAAIRALGQTEDLRAESTLRTLQDTHPSERVQVLAAEALAKVRKGLDGKDGKKK